MTAAPFMTMRAQFLPHYTASPQLGHVTLQLVADSQHGLILLLCSLQYEKEQFTYLIGVPC